MVYYYAICGSRSHGIELPTSDYDVVYCGDEKPVKLREHSHNITPNREGLIYKLFLQYMIPHNLQVYFPAEIIQNTDVTQYILSNREHILAARAKRIYDSYMFYGDNFLKRPDTYYRWIKDAVYSCMYYDILYRYATKDMSFEEAFHPQGDFKEWLMAVRRNEVERDEVLKVFDECKTKALSCADFYEDKLDKTVLDGALLDLNDLFGTSVKMTFNK